MIADGSLRWICTVLFVSAASYCIYRIAAVRQATVRIDHGFHLAMCAAMIAMAWPWGLGVPLVPQGVFFAAATVWFAVAAVRTHTAARNTVDEHGHGPVMGCYHAFMMAAMVWMVAVMAGWLPGAAAHDHTTDSSADEMAGMGAHEHTPGMDMGMHSTGMSAGAGWTSTVSLVIAVVFAAAAIVWLYRLFVAEQAAALAPANSGSASGSASASAGSTAVAVLPASRLPTVAAACEVAMAAGMAIMMGVM